MKISNIIKDHYKELSPYEKRVADKILENKIDIIKHSITQAAQISGVSPSLINKFCIKIGATGWKTLRGLNFIELRSESYYDEYLFNEDFNLIQNTMIKQSKQIDAFIRKLYNKMYAANKVLIFANGSTKLVAEMVAYKWNKLGGNIVIYDFTESFISIEPNTVVIYLTISGHNNKIKYYQEQSKANDNFIITFGKVKDFKGTGLELDIFKHFGKIEKAFPVITDVFIHFLLNKFIEIKVKDSRIIEHKVQNIKMKDV